MQVIENTRLYYANQEKLKHEAFVSIIISNIERILQNQSDGSLLRMSLCAAKGWTLSKFYKKEINPFQLLGHSLSAEITAEDIGKELKVTVKSLLEMQDSFASIIPNFFTELISEHFGEDSAFISLAHFLEIFKHYFNSQNSKKVGNCFLELLYSSFNFDSFYDVLVLKHELIDCKSVNLIIQSSNFQKAISSLADRNSHMLIIGVFICINWLVLGSYPDSAPSNVITELLMNHLKHFKISEPLVHDIQTCFVCIVELLDKDSIDCIFTTFKKQYGLIVAKTKDIYESVFYCFENPTIWIECLPNSFYHNLFFEYYSFFQRSTSVKRIRLKNIFWISLHYLMDLSLNEYYNHVQFQNYIDRMENFSDETVLGLEVRIPKTLIPFNEQLQQIFNNKYDYGVTKLSKIATTLLIRLKKNNHFVPEFCKLMIKILKKRGLKKNFNVEDTMIYGILEESICHTPKCLSPLSLDDIITSAIDNLNDTYFGNLILDSLEPLIEAYYTTNESSTENQYILLDKFLKLLAKVRMNNADNSYRDADDLVELLLDKDVWNIMQIVNVSDTLKSIINFILNHPEKTGKVLKNTLKKILFVMQYEQQNFKLPPPNVIHVIIIKQILKEPDFFALFGVHFIDLLVVRPSISLGSELIVLVPKPMSAINMFESIFRGELYGLLKNMPVFGELFFDIPRLISKGDFSSVVDKCLIISVFIINFLGHVQDEIFRLS